MPFVQRENEKIVGVYAKLQPGYAEEEMPEDDEAVIAFLNPPLPPAASVSSLQVKLQLASMGLTDPQIDAFFVAASKL